MRTQGSLIVARSIFAGGLRDNSQRSPDTHGPAAVGSGAARVAGYRAFSTESQTGCQGFTSAVITAELEIYDVRVNKNRKERFLADILVERGRRCLRHDEVIIEATGPRADARCGVGASPLFYNDGCLPKESLCFMPRERCPRARSTWVYGLPAQVAAFPRAHTPQTQQLPEKVSNDQTVVVTASDASLMWGRGGDRQMPLSIVPDPTPIDEGRIITKMHSNRRVLTDHSSVAELGLVASGAGSLSHRARYRGGSELSQFGLAAGAIAYH